MVLQLASRLFLIAATGAAAQAPDAVTNQHLLDELKAVNATLAKVVDELAKTQKAQLMLARIQIDESRSAALELQRRDLAAQERGLIQEAEEAATLVAAEEAGLIKTAEGAPSTGWTRREEAERALEEVRQTRSSVEQQLATLRKRIAATEKRLEEAVR
jgi:chromosome segregation ATPase